ncbi:MAG TPA: glycosyltransferase, partial [Nocardioidaceae bacterium]|nr:glycosyltransferase [Nocardioidaceae bacterium]
APLLGVIDADGSMDPAVLSQLADIVQTGSVTMAVGRRRPVGRGVWPWHARAGNAIITARLRRRAGVPVHDIAPVRVCRRQDLLDLDIRDRRFGYPLELLVKAGAAGWMLREVDIEYRPRAAGTRSKVSGSVRGTLRAARDFASVLP